MYLQSGLISLSETSPYPWFTRSTLGAPSPKPGKDAAFTAAVGNQRQHLSKFRNLLSKVAK